MNFDLSDVQQSWRDRARALGRALPPHASADVVVAGAARAGLLDPRGDLLAVTAATEALAAESAPAGVVYALHCAAMAAVGGDPRVAALSHGDMVAALTLSTEAVPVADDGHLAGWASWIGPLAARGVAILAGRRRERLVACAVPLDAPGTRIVPVESAGLNGVVFGHATFERAACEVLGPPVPIMARVRILLAAAGLGMGQRALREALAAARGHTGHGAGGEQTVQGLLADAATELDAALLLTWKAAAGPGLSLAEASMAKLAAIEAAQRAVARATQVVGADSFREGHVIARLAQDVRALELFAGRTEALREAVASELLPLASLPS